MRPGRPIALFASVLAAGFVLTACGGNAEQEDRMSQSRSASTTDQATADEALRFGGIVPPPSAKVLGVQHEKGIDERHRVVLGVDAREVPALLSASKFTAPLAPDSGPFQASVDGFDLAKAKSVRAGEDSIAQGEGRTVFRQIAVDETDPARSVVHLWLFTT